MSDCLSMENERPRVLCHSLHTLGLWLGVCGFRRWLVDGNCNPEIININPMIIECLPSPPCRGKRDQYQLIRKNSIHSSSFILCLRLVVLNMSLIRTAVLVGFQSLGLWRILDAVSTTSSTGILEVAVCFWYFLVPSGYVKIAIENGHWNNEFTH